MLKKIITTIGALACLAGATIGNSPARAQASFEDRDWKIGVSTNNAKHPFMVAFIDEVNREVAKYPNVEAIIMDGNYDATKQNNDVEDLITQRVDIIIIRPHQGATAKAAVVAAKRAGIPLIIVERRIPAPEEDYLAFVKADGVGEGKLLGDLLQEKLGGEGTIGELRGTEGTPDAVERGEGFRKGIADASGMKIVSSQTAQYQRLPALDATTTMLEAHPNLDAIFAHNDEMALGAVRGVEAAGKAGEIRIMGMDGQSDAFEAIRSGEMFATVIHPLQSKEAIDLAIRHLKGESVPKLLTVSGILVTRNNISEMKPNY